MPIHARTRLLLGLVLAGCVGAPPFPPTPENALGEGSSSSSGSGDNQNPDPMADGAITSDSGSTGHDSTATDEPPSATGDSSELLISDGPQYEFGVVSVGQLAQAALTVTNTGDTEATSMAGRPLAPPFDYTGGAYPGAGGTCTDRLAPGSSCVVDLSFHPENLGLHHGTFAVDYDEGRETTRPLTGGGAGQSANLLVNPGGEDQGSPPPGWTNIEAGEWAADVPSTGVSAHQGAGCLQSLDGPSFTEFALVQDIDISQWSTTIDQGVMHFDFIGWGRTYEFGNDQYRFVVRYRDAQEQQLDSWTTDWIRDAFWAIHSTSGPTPVGTRTVRVELNCVSYTPGTTRCDAYFDALELHAVYP
ncbi:MAG: hypothetical protein AAGF11_27035 [Myxococcota bacterium]